MPIGTLYQDLIDEVISQLKTLTPELADDIAAEGGARVIKWMDPRSPKRDRFEAVVMAGPMEPLDGTTTKSTNNEFQIIVDLIFYATTFDAGFDSVMGVAERIYDKFHLTDVGGLCRLAKVALFPGDGVISGRNLLAIPIRIIIRCEKVITQT